MKQFVLVLDFGGQYKELIAGMVRQQSVYSEIHPGNLSIDEIKRLKPIGIILTGGSNSVYTQSKSTTKVDPKLFELGIPILGICYGMQLMCHALGGLVEDSGTMGHGRVQVLAVAQGQLAVDDSFYALMSHRDTVTKIPDGFNVTMKTANCIAGVENVKKKLYGVQFHPETKHTENGFELMQRFLYKICGAKGDYKLSDYIDKQIKQIREKVGEHKVLLGLSGGVDSSVCAALLERAIPEQLTCVFVDHGFMRLNEGDEIERIFSNKNLNFIRVNAQNRFLAKVAGVTEPEEKRKLIGEEFVRAFEDAQNNLFTDSDINKGVFLAQGTIYPDIVESGGKHGATIKSHHNVGGLPDDHKFKGLVEPLSGLFKDEVRELGVKLGLPAALINRQPFPGPGLSVRIVGKITKEKLDTLREADAIVREEIENAFTDRTSDGFPAQFFAVMTDTYSVGVKGDKRTYSPVIAIRAVITDDFMTCEYAPLQHELLNRISSRITSTIANVSRVVYDITSKPPGTIEWE
ncbi:MAG: glutamine-hydrolyzing GMP synthase [Oscillospiraceae bacterium]|nr:glutamine-hydrolyzing GMP synthase [Oscillospiraceae bacterium]